MSKESQDLKFSWLLFAYFFKQVFYHYGGFREVPNNPMPLLYLPSIAEILAFIYSDSILI